MAVKGSRENPKGNPFLSTFIPKNNFLLLGIFLFYAERNLNKMII
tara:strand:+ start:682 stop:816 length:135 start_codon:yes stop_codon:yes gene_type:complete